MIKRAGASAGKGLRGVGECEMPRQHGGGEKVGDSSDRQAGSPLLQGADAGRPRCGSSRAGTVRGRPMGWGSPLPAGRVLVDARAGRGVGWPDQPASAGKRA